MNHKKSKFLFILAVVFFSILLIYAPQSAEAAEKYTLWQCGGKNWYDCNQYFKVSYYRNACKNNNPYCCIDSCSIGTSTCSGSYKYTCIEDNNGCMVWSSGAYCDYGCANGQCKNPPYTLWQCGGKNWYDCNEYFKVSYYRNACKNGNPGCCKDVCSSIGEAKCSGSYKYTCTEDSNGCRGWDSGAYCDYGCSAGSCNQKPSCPSPKPTKLTPTSQVNQPSTFCESGEWTKADYYKYDEGCTQVYERVWTCKACPSTRTTQLTDNSQAKEPSGCEGGKWTYQDEYAQKTVNCVDYYNRIWTCNCPSTRPTEVIGQINQPTGCLGGEWIKQETTSRQGCKDIITRSWKCECTQGTKNWLIDSSKVNAPTSGCEGGKWTFKDKYADKTVDCVNYYERAWECKMPEPVCGNNKIEGYEQCDNSNLNGQTCSSLGYACGALSCSSCSFNKNNCYTPNLQSDSNNCGSCGKICPYGTKCESGICKSTAKDCIDSNCFGFNCVSYGATCRKNEGYSTDIIPFSEEQLPCFCEAAQIPCKCDYYGDLNEPNKPPINCEFGLNGAEAISCQPGQMQGCYYDFNAASNLGKYTQRCSPLNKWPTICKPTCIANSENGICTVNCDSCNNKAWFQCACSDNDCSDGKCEQVCAKDVCKKEESIARNNCQDYKDNDDDKNMDYDGNPKGDDGCPVGITAISVNNYNPAANEWITVDCASTVKGVRSIKSSIDNVGECVWISWQGNAARFTCNVGKETGIKTVRCSINDAISYKDIKNPEKTAMIAVCEKGMLYDAVKGMCNKAPVVSNIDAINDLGEKAAEIESEGKKYKFLANVKSYRIILDVNDDGDLNNLNVGVQVGIAYPDATNFGSGSEDWMPDADGTDTKHRMSISNGMCYCTNSLGTKCYSMHCESKFKFTPDLSEGWVSLIMVYANADDGTN